MIPYFTINATYYRKQIDTDNQMTKECALISN